MDPRIYDKLRKEHFNQHPAILHSMTYGFPSVNGNCLNEANTIKHCLRKNKLSVIDNASTWESKCSTEGFYKHCRGKDQLHMVETMWL